MTSDPDPVTVTLATYEATARRFRGLGMVLPPELRAFLDQIVDRVDAGEEVLEIGSGPGRDAQYLERRGLRVRRTDATPAFVEIMRADGYEAHLLDIRTDDLGGPHAAVLANAVLLHLSRPELVRVLVRIRESVVDGALFAFTLKEGDGELWTDVRLDLPRHFTFWREPEMRNALAATGWRVESLRHVAGRADAWMQILAAAAPR